MQQCSSQFSPLDPATWFVDAFIQNHISCEIRIVDRLNGAYPHTCITEQTLFQYTPESWRLRIHWPSTSVRVLAPGVGHASGAQPVWLEWTNKFANHWAIEWIKLGLTPKAPGSLPQVLPKDGTNASLADENPRWTALATLTNQLTGDICEVRLEWLCPSEVIPLTGSHGSDSFEINTGALLDILPLGTILLDKNDNIVRLNTWLKRNEPALLDTKLPVAWAEMFTQDWLCEAREHQSKYLRATYRTPWLHPDEKISYLKNGPYTLSLTPAGNGSVLQLTPLLENKVELQFERWDRLTGLHTRESWLNTVGSLLQTGRKTAYWAGIIGIDGFQSLNDTLGHSAGDWLLSELAGRLASYYADAVLGRWAGDEFVIFAPGTLPPAPFDVLLENPFIYNNSTFNARCSGGIIEIAQDSTETASQFIQYAEWALREAKELGGNQTLRAVNTLSQNRKNLFYIENGLTTAVKNRQFYLLYQPLVDLKTNKIVGAEALIRWEHPEIGQITPTNFIPVAEQTGAIIPLTSWVLETACREVNSWVNPFDNFFISVNLSPSQFYDPNLVDNLKELLVMLNFPAENLKLEITEGVVLLDNDHNTDVLMKLRALGVGLSIDDFGTGYSSLSYLKDFPVQQLKIDRSFVQGIEREHSRSLTQNIINLAHNMGLLVVAEGVETDEQARILRDIGCDIVQGYKYGQPMEPHKLHALLIEQKIRTLF